ncbi:hypothetical protein [Phenylobacterium sp.]|uniref:hypothetical protein n=1 Tax=Phenylobacterium sp. TaxID=1871053 RepID=UPI0035AF7968
MNDVAKSRLKVGLDVPWVTSWSGEAVLGVGPCASVGGRLAVRQAERPGFGRPNYSRNHLRRQRLTVARMLCPMCGEPTPEDDRWLQTARRTTAGILRARSFAAALPPALGDDRVVVDAGAIAPCHLACAGRAAAHCPHLQAHTSGELIAFPYAWIVLPLMVRAGPTHVLDSTARPASAVSFLQLCGITTETDRAWRSRAPLTSADS